jgi:hypothetical protein
MKWHENLLLDGDTPALVERGQHQLAMYAIHLSAGHSIYCRSIKVATIEQYLLAAASFVAQFTGIDFCKERPTDVCTQLGHTLASVLKDLKKYDSVPDRREPYDPQMHAAAARSLAAQCSSNTLLCALTDGFEQGYCAGYRLSEWAQPSRRSDPMDPQLNHLPGAAICTRALVPDDLLQNSYCFPSSGLRPLHPSPCAAPNIQNVGQVPHPEEWPKRGRETLCSESQHNRILFCFFRLPLFGSLPAPNGARPTPSPQCYTTLCVYWSAPHTNVKLITADNIECFIRCLPSSVYHLDPVRDALDLH